MATDDRNTGNNAKYHIIDYPLVRKDPLHRNIM